MGAACLFLSAVYPFMPTLRTALPVLRFTFPEIRTTHKVLSAYEGIVVLARESRGLPSRIIAARNGRFCSVTVLDAGGSSFVTVYTLVLYGTAGPASKWILKRPDWTPGAGLRSLLLDSTARLPIFKSYLGSDSLWSDSTP